MIWIQRGLLVLTLAFAGLTIWLALEIQAVPLPDEFTLPNGFETPILAMEFPRDAADFVFVRGLENEAMRRHVYVVQYIDQYFPYAYGGLLASFLASILFMLWHRSRARQLNAILMIPFLSVLAYSVISSDFLENGQIDLAMMLIWQGSPAATDLLDQVAALITQLAWVKWTYIAAMTAMVSVILGALNYRISGGLVLIPVLATLYARFIDPAGPAIELMAQAIAVFFLAIPVMAVYFLVQSFRRTEPENESPRQVET